MGDSVEAELAYGGLLLSCDEEAFARLLAYVCAEPSVAEAVHGTINSLDVRFISIRPPISESCANPTGHGWLALIPTIIGSCLSGVALIVGFVTIARWLMRLAAF
jgi:hypothetical protein